jgi:hypothetical protein
MAVAALPNPALKSRQHAEEDTAVVVGNGATALGLIVEVVPNGKL